MKGATINKSLKKWYRHNFNPRTREGCDVRTCLLTTSLTSISIHAPVKGATAQQAEATANAIKISIHAPVKGATRPEHYATWAGFIFQSTHP